jgi:DNA-binding NarL/FixJ family response regulator
MGTLNITRHGNPLKVLVIDYHPAFILGVDIMIKNSYPNAEIHQARSARTAKSMLRNLLDLDCIFLDYKLPDQDGLLFLQELNNSEIRSPVIMMSSHTDIALVDRALKYGAMAYMFKSSTPQHYQECLASIVKGHRFLSNEIQRELSYYKKTIQLEENGIKRQLFNRQLEILVLIAGGYSNIEISKTLEISKSAVKYHNSKLMDIFNARNRTECVAEARRLRILN